MYPVNVYKKQKKDTSCDLNKDDIDCVIRALNVRNITLLEQEYLMMGVETENYIRLLLVLVRVGMLVCKGIIDKELKLEDAALHVVLERRKIEHMKKLLKHQKLILFPKNGNPHVNDLDLSLLTFVLQNVMDLSDTEKENVKVIKETRNTLAHTSTASIENAKYKTLKKDLEDALERLCLGLDVSLQAECSTLIQKFTSEPLDEATVLKYAKELRNEDKLLQDLEGMLEEHSIRIVQEGMLEEHSIRIVQEVKASENRIQKTLS
ncbi:uncharacterized protein LOC128554223, partial [Mercenaria mercenaria]|uniref:uncharacterized protein LOC128554223 n=1 Tax=Mercenaria mercenaria TaxID=6596 RepID=UPI00234F9C8F